MALNPFSLPWSRSPTVAPPFPRLRPRTPACRPPPTRSSGDNQCSNCRLMRWNWTQTFSFPQPTFRPARCGDNGANGEADQVTILLRCPRASSCLWWVPAQEGWRLCDRVTVPGVSPSTPRSAGAAAPCSACSGCWGTSTSSHTRWTPSSEHTGGAMFAVGDGWEMVLFISLLQRFENV